MLSNFKLKRMKAEAMQELVDDNGAALAEFGGRVLQSFEQWKQEKGDRKPRGAPSGGLLSSVLGKPIPFKKATPWQCADFMWPSPFALAMKLWREDYRPFMEIMKQDDYFKVLEMLVVVFGKDAHESDLRWAQDLLRDNKSFKTGMHFALQPQKTNLAKGRKEGVLERQKKAEKNRAVLINAIKDLFDKPEKPGWGWMNDEIVKFLKKGNYGYADSSILTVVKREAAKHRKTRKK